MNIKRNYSVLLFKGVALSALYLFFSCTGLQKKGSLDSKSFETYVVDSGDVVQTWKTEGIVESENEALILSPASSIVDRILKEPGSYVKSGEIIVQLNPEPIQVDIDRLKDQIEVKRNNLEKTQLNSQSNRLDLDYNEEVKKLKIKSLKSQLADQQQLLEVGGISPAKIEETKQEIVLAEKDLSMMKEKNIIRLKQLTAEEKGLILQIRIDEKMLQEKTEMAEKMNIAAPSSGIILAISAQEGEKVNADKLLVRMSDLSSFKIIGSVEEKNANLVKTGFPVLVRIENDKLTGTIGNITPMVENSKIQFNVHLNENSHPKLISNQKVEIHIITGQKQNTLRIRNFEGKQQNGKKQVLIKRKNQVVKSEIETGIEGDEFCEIVSGLEKGDTVILQDPDKFPDVSEIDFK